MAVAIKRCVQRGDLVPARHRGTGGQAAVATSGSDIHRSPPMAASAGGCLPGIPPRRRDGGWATGLLALFGEAGEHVPGRGYNSYSLDLNIVSVYC